MNGETVAVESTSEPNYAAPNTYQKGLNLRQARVDAMPVEMAKWQRLKERIEHLESQWSINWLSAGGSASASVALSAFIAAVSIPTGSDSGISPAVQPSLLVGAGSAALLAVAFFVFFLVEKHGRIHEGGDIVDEMETEEEAWEQREGLD